MTQVQYKEQQVTIEEVGKKGASTFNVILKGKESSFYKWSEQSLYALHLALKLIFEKSSSSMYEEFSDGDDNNVA